MFFGLLEHNGGFDDASIEGFRVQGLGGGSGFMVQDLGFRPEVISVFRCRGAEMKGAF